MRRGQDPLASAGDAGPNASRFFHISHSGQHSFVKGGGIAIKIDELNAIPATDQGVITTGLEETIDYRLVLEVDTIDDQSKLVFGHLFPPAFRDAHSLLRLRQQSGECIRFADAAAFGDDSP